MNVFYLILKLFFTESGQRIKLRKRAVNEIIEILIENGIDINIEAYLDKAYEDFMARVKDRVKNNYLSADVGMLKQCFKEKEDVAINTFHVVKGEEYTTVIAFGILNGYIPYWYIMLNKSLGYREDATKNYCILFVHGQRKIYFFFQNKVVLCKGERYYHQRMGYW